VASLATTLSEKLNTARLPLKELRSNEVTFTQRHSIRTGLEQQISRTENSREKGYEKRLAELKEQLAKAESDDEPADKQHDILLRKALRESEQLKFQALREVIKIVWAQLTIVSLPPFPSTEKSLRLSHRLLSLSWLLYPPFPRRQASLTRPWSRRVPFVHLCSTHWITGSLVKPLSLHLRMCFWIVLARAALARLTLQNYSRSTHLSIRVSRSLLAKEVSGRLDPIPRPRQSLSKFLFPSQLRNCVPRAIHRLPPCRRGRLPSVHPWPRAQHPRVSIPRS
jgi:hypothetical protein